MPRGSPTVEPGRRRRPSNAGETHPTAESADEVLEQARALGYERRDLASLFEVLQKIGNGENARSR